MSSANSLISADLVYLGMSFMKTRKRSGPRTDPWGTPLVTETASEDSPSTTTLWVRPVRKDWIHFRALGSIRVRSSLYSR